MPGNRRSQSIDRRHYREHRRTGNHEQKDRFNKSRASPANSRDSRRERSPQIRDNRPRSPAASIADNSGRERSPLARPVILDRSYIAAKNHDDHSASWNQSNFDTPKKRFTGRCRLFVGNLPSDLKEDDLRALFSKYGEISECYLSGKGFGFLRLDTRAHAEVAKEELDGFMLKGRPIRVRFAVHGAAVKVKGLSGLASNELLQQAFSVFGNVERAVHIVDDRGRPTGEGIVEFEKKPGSLDALRRINEGVFLLTANPKPIIVEQLEPKDDDDGLVERMIVKNPNYHQERSQGPRFATPGTFEFDFGNRWKALYQAEREKRDQLEKELKDARDRLENEMEYAYQEYQAAMLREDLRRRQEELERLESAKRERMEMLRRQGEERMRSNFGGGGPTTTQASFVPGLFSGFPGMGNVIRPPPQQHQQFQHQYSATGNRQDGPPPFARTPQTREDTNLVHGVQRLLQMIHHDPAAGAFGIGGPQPGGISQQGVGLLGHQPPNSFYGGPEMGAVMDQPRQQQQQHGRGGDYRDNRGQFESSRRRHQSPNRR